MDHVAPSPTAAVAAELEETLMALFEKGMLKLNRRGEIVLTPEGWREVDGMGPG